MARNNPKVAYLEEALSFIESIPKSAGDKLLEIVHRVELGERNPIYYFLEAGRYGDMGIQNPLQ